MAWSKGKITLENGKIVEAQVPKIVSASRSTDIPAFYADWFFHRLKIGYSAWTNPFNGVKSHISYNDTRFIVFWSKNPKPLLQHLDYLKEREINCYIQYTLNDYDDERLEPNVPNLQYRIDTFRQLVDYFCDTKHVIWRFDPLMLTKKIDEDLLLEKIDRVGDALKGYTEKMVFSFADIAIYRRVKKNLIDNRVAYKEWSGKNQMLAFAARLSELNKKWGYRLATCGEEEIFGKYGIEKNRCIDDEQIIRIAHNDRILCDYLSYSISNDDSIFHDKLDIGNGLFAEKLRKTTYNSKDKGQRLLCGCIVAKDIGEYNTCPHLCEYCYANSSKIIALKNYQTHLSNKFNETITGG